MRGCGRRALAPFDNCPRILANTRKRSKIAYARFDVILIAPTPFLVYLPPVPVFVCVSEMILVCVTSCTVQDWNTPGGVLSVND